MDYLSESWSLLTLYLLTYLGRPGAALVRNGEGHVHAVVRLSLQCGISLSVLSHEAALVRRVLGLICTGKALVIGFSVASRDAKRSPTLAAQAELDLQPDNKVSSYEFHWGPDDCCPINRTWALTLMQVLLFYQLYAGTTCKRQRSG